MSDRLDGDPDGVIESDEPNTAYESAFDTAPAVPEVSIPEPPQVGSGDDPDTDAEDVDPELRKGFWTLVFVVKFALLSLTLGALFLYFEGRVGLGGQLLAFGIVLGLYGAYRYRIVRTRLDEGEFDDPNPSTDEGEYDDPNPSTDEGEYDDPNPSTDEGEYDDPNPSTGDATEASGRADTVTPGRSDGTDGGRSDE